MSSYFRGVTFAEQPLTPSDDAVLRRAFLSDGVLEGCAFSYSGSTLTMEAGAFLICGRQVRHTTVQQWPVVDAQSGFARLVITADLSRTATEDTFDQVNEHIEYAASADGFAVLEETDINKAGVRYQIEACVVSLGTSGITGIVRTLPQIRAMAEAAPVLSGTLAVAPQKYTVTLALEGGGSDVVVLETDANDYPQKITVNGREIPWTVTGV